MCNTLSSAAVAILSGHFTHINMCKPNEILIANIEALTGGDDDDSDFYYVTKYDLCKMLEVTNVSGEIATMIDVGKIITPSKLIELQGSFKGEVEVKSVDSHKRVCLRTTKKQTIVCPGSDKDWQSCHSGCKHENNQI